MCSVRDESFNTYSNGFLFIEINNLYYMVEICFIVVKVIVFKCDKIFFFFLKNDIFV